MVLQKSVTINLCWITFNRYFAGSFNLLLPILGNYKLIWVGPLFTIVFLGLIFIAIVRYQLFNIRLLVGKIIYVLCSAVLIYVSFLFFLNVHNTTFPNSFAWEAIIFGIVCQYCLPRYMINSEIFYRKHLFQDYKFRL